MSRLMKTKGQLEAEIGQAVTKFEKEHMGRGPLETKTYLVDDLVIVRLRGILTKAEHELVKSGRNGRGRELIKQMRMELLETGRELLEDAIKDILRIRVLSMHADLSTVTGEKMIILTLDRPPEYF